MEVDCDKGAVAVERLRAERKRGVRCLRGAANVLAARRERLASIVSGIWDGFWEVSQEKVYKSLNFPPANDTTQDLIPSTSLGQPKTISAVRDGHGFHFIAYSTLYGPFNNPPAM